MIRRLTGRPLPSVPGARAPVHGRPASIPLGIRAGAIAFVISLAPLPALAQTDEPDGSSAPITEHRPPPDYDEREDEPADAGEALLWIPRILFAPVTLVLDYGLRHPLGALATLAERERWVDWWLALLTWNEHRSGIVPTFVLAYGLQPSIGILFFSNDEVAPGHSIHANLDFGGVDLLGASASYVILHRERVRFAVGGEVARRPDRIFSGIGWDSPAAQYRFRERWYDAWARMRTDFWRESAFVVQLGVDGHAFEGNGYSTFAGWGSGPLDEAIQSGAVEAPYGLDAPYVVARPRMQLAIDSREREPRPGHGFRIVARVEIAMDLNDVMARRWARWGGSAGGFLDLGHRRVLGISGLVAFSDPLGSEPVPFTELVTLGQEVLLMRGFMRGQLRGRSAMAATLEYLYPIWTMLDARLHVSLGNAFDAHFVDFAPERLRLSFGIALATAGDPDDAFEVILAAGTAPFVEGTGVQSLQLVFGSRNNL